MYPRTVIMTVVNVSRPQFVGDIVAATGSR
jgi:hypothetical protein